MARDHSHDLATDDERAEEYEAGRRGRWRAKVAARSADVALANTPIPLRVLDVGCGTGMLLREMVDRLPNVLEIAGVDPSEGMLRVAREHGPEQIGYARASADRLPYEDGRFDLIVSTMSFHHWRSQSAGLAEVARVLAPGGTFVLVDLSGRWIRRTEGREDVRNPGEIEHALRGARLRPVKREVVKRKAGLPYVRAFVATG
jgi:ubiquinone/menaquinone biosynthesis C-methylase UbiE